MTIRINFKTNNHFMLTTICREYKSIAKMCYLFKIKIQNLAHRIEFSESELNENLSTIKELFFSKGE